MQCFFYAWLTLPKWMENTPIPKTHAAKQS
jgi:hypothetical protein